MVRDGAIVTMGDQQKVVHGLSNRANLNDLERRSQTQISRSGHSLMLNISEMTKYTAIVSTRWKYYGRRIRNHTQAFKWLHFQWLEWPTFQGHDDIQRQITSTNSTSCMIYQMVPFSVTLSDPWPIDPLLMPLCAPLMRDLFAIAKFVYITLHWSHSKCPEVKTAKPLNGE